MGVFHCYYVCRCVYLCMCVCVRVCVCVCMWVVTTSSPHCVRQRAEHRRPKWECGERRSIGTRQMAHLSSGECGSG